MSIPSHPITPAHPTVPGSVKKPPVVVVVRPPPQVVVVSPPGGAEPVYEAPVVVAPSGAEPVYEAPVVVARPPVGPEPVYETPAATADRPASEPPRVVGGGSQGGAEPVYETPPATGDQPTSEQPQPTADTSPPGPADAGGGTFVTVAFQPNITPEDIGTFLKAYNVAITDGPSPDGHYRIQLSDSSLPPDQVQQVVTSMQSQTAFVASVRTN